MNPFVCVILVCIAACGSTATETPATTASPSAAPRPSAEEERSEAPEPDLSVDPEPTPEASTETSTEASAETPSTPTASAETPSVDYGTFAPEFQLEGLASIRAYSINLDGDAMGRSLINRSGALNDDREPEDGVALTRRQAQALFRAVSREVGGYPMARCYNPHHGFAFLSSEGELLGHISVCFECSTHQSTDELAQRSVNLPALRRLVRALGLRRYT